MYTYLVVLVLFFGVRRCWGGVGGIRLLMACNTSLSADEVHYESYNCVNCSNCGNPFLYSCTLIGKVMSPPYRYFHSSPSVVFLKARNRSTCLSALWVCCYTVFLLNAKCYADLYSPIQGSGTREAPGLEPETWVVGHKLPRTDRGQWILQHKEHTRSRYYCNNSWGQYADD